MSATKNRVAAGYGSNAAEKAAPADKTMILGSQQTNELRAAVKQALASRETATLVMNTHEIGLPLRAHAPAKPHFDPMATTIVDSLDSPTPSAAANGVIALRRAAEPQTAKLRSAQAKPNKLGLLAAVLGGLALVGAYAKLAPMLRKQPAQVHLVRPAARLPSQPAAAPPKSVAPLPTASTANMPAAAGTVPEAGRQPPLAAVQPAQPTAAEAVAPAQAARAFALGDDERALTYYRELSRQNPQERSYAIMVNILTARQRNDSHD